MGFKQVLRDFSGWTSAHGIPHMGSAHNYCLRCFWTMVFVFSLGGFSYFFISLLIRYFKFGVKFQTELKFEEQQFPAITICNINPYRNDRIPQNTQIEELIQAYNYLAHNNGSGYVKPANLYGLDQVANDIERRIKARKVLEILVNKIDVGAPPPAAPATTPVPGAHTTTAADDTTTTPDLTTTTPDITTILTTTLSSTTTTTTNTNTDTSTTFSTTSRSSSTGTTTTSTPSTTTTTTSTTSTTTTTTSTTTTTTSTTSTTTTVSTSTTTTAAPDWTTHDMKYTIEDMVIACTYNGNGCDYVDIPDDYSYVFDPIYGQCLQFNNNPAKMEGFYTTTRSGPLYGLKMLLRVDQSLYLPFIDSAGIRLVVHPQGSEHFIDAYGNTANPGFTTTFGIKTVETVRLRYPYGECTTEKNENYLYDEGEYAAEGCIRSCIQKFIISTCGCASPLYPISATETAGWCDETKVDCMEVATNGTFDVISECHCIFPCSEVEYSATLSVADWPSAVFLPAECIKAGVAGSVERAACHKWYKKNTVMIVAYFERMNYQKLFESEDYKSLALISDTGGQLGFFLGISFITVVEIVALVFLLCLFLFSSNKSGEFNDADIDKEIEREFDEDFCKKPVEPIAEEEEDDAEGEDEKPEDEKEKDGKDDKKEDKEEDKKDEQSSEEDSSSDESTEDESSDHDEKDKEED